MPKPQFTLYTPTDYDGNKHRSVDAYHGRHELQWQGARAHEGIIIVRFELMFKVVCAGCERYISMGNRYDADKKIIGKYHSTPVYKFTMNCHICLCKWEIRTDPETLDYVCMSGCRRKEENWDTRDVNGLTTIDSEVKKKLLGDKMYNKEYKSDDKRKAAVRADELRFVEVSRKIRKYDYDLNRELRVQAKARREKEQAKEKEKMDFKKSKGVATDELILLSSDDEDTERARQLLSKSSEKRKKLDEKMASTTNLVPTWNSDSEEEDSRYSNTPPTEDTPCSSKTASTLSTLSSSKKSTTPTATAPDLEKSPKSKIIDLDSEVSAEQQMFLNKKRNSAKDAKIILRSNIGTDLTRNIIGKGRKTDLVLKNSSFKNFKKSPASKSSVKVKSNLLNVASSSKSLPFGGGFGSRIQSGAGNKAKLASMVRLKKK